MSVLLEETRAQLKMAGNGIEALALLEREAFDLMFLDIQMPDMDGYETIKIMRERGYVLPVVALTAMPCNPTSSAVWMRGGRVPSTVNSAALRHHP